MHPCHIPQQTVFDATFFKHKCPNIISSSILKHFYSDQQQSKRMASHNNKIKLRKIFIYDQRKHILLQQKFCQYLDSIFQRFFILLILCKAFVSRESLHPSSAMLSGQKNMTRGGQSSISSICFSSASYQVLRPEVCFDSSTRISHFKYQPENEIPMK